MLKCYIRDYLAFKPSKAKITEKSLHHKDKDKKQQNITGERHTHKNTRTIQDKKHKTKPHTKQPYKNIPKHKG